MAADLLVELWSLPLSIDEKLQISLKLATLRLENKDPSVYITAPSPEYKAAVLRDFLKESAPRIENEEYMDLTYKTLSEFCTPVLPSLDNLASFLVSKPDGLKIWVSPRTYHRVRSYDVNDLFQPSTGDCCYALEEHLAGCILPAPDTGVSECSFIQAWDNLINTPVKLFLNVPFKKDRNNAGTDKFMPDFVGYVGGQWSLWIAEEKQEGVGDPLQELVSKRKWCYRAVPYILGYFARGLSVTLVALYHEQGIVKSKTLANYNLYEIADRIDLFMVALNVGRVLGSLHEICVKNNEGSELEVVKTICSGKSVMVAGDVVIKGYPTKEKRMKVWEIYSALKGCPNMEICLSRKPTAEDVLEVKRRKVDEFTLRFSPRLSRHARVTTQEMLVKALLDVTTALAWLQMNKWIHRDVRWPNVALNEATQVWTLIDADEACRFERANKAHPLCEEGHAPEMLQGCHGSAVDVWGLGCLIRTARNVAVTSATVDSILWELSLKCVMVDPNARPSLSECRRELERCREILHAEC